MTNRKPLGIRIGFLLLAASSLVNGGCLIAAAGVAGGAAVSYAYCEGKMCHAFQAGLEDATAAVATSLAELGMPIEKETRDPHENYFLSRTADHVKVRIYLTPQPNKIPAAGPSTRICVRVGVFGDPDVSALILNQISAHLVAGPVAERAPLPQHSSPIAPPPQSMRPIPSHSPLQTPAPPAAGLQPAGNQTPGVPTSQTKEPPISLQ